MSGSETFATAGDHATEFDQIYRDQLGFVWRSLRSMGVPEAVVEDATHEVFVVLHRRLSDWDRRSKITTWLYGIARGVARNTRRQQQRSDRKLQAVQTRTAEQSGSFARPDQRADRAEAAALLAMFLEQLDDPKRAVFELCAIEGLSAAEAGRCLQENPNTISTRLRRARQLFTAFVHDVNERSA